MADGQTESAGDPRERTSELLIEALGLLEDQGPEAVERLLAAHPELAEQVRSRLRLLAGAGFLEGPDPAVPERLGEFVLRERLGGGGMGVVYVADQPSLGREVALKVVRPELVWVPQTRERFRREVQVVARLQHPGIVQVYSVGEDRGLPWFAMERVHGATFAELLDELEGTDPATLDDAGVAAALERLREAAGRGGPLVFEPRGVSWVALCLRWARDLGRALEHAHENGVLHRDVKPSNAMLGWDGRVRLLDFGLASSGEDARLTRTGSRLGSLPYMAPEQLRQGGDAVDARTDVYALGVTLHELLTLSNPFHPGDEGEELVMRRILEGAPPRLRARNGAVPWDVETICQVATDPEPERRYADAGALARDIDNVLALRPLQARRPGPALRVRRWLQRHPARAMGAALAFFALVVGPSAFALRERTVGREMRRARDAAELEAEITRATLAFLNDDLLAAVSPDEVGREASMRAVLDLAAERVEGRFPDQPLVEAALRETIGNTYRLLGLTAPAERHLLAACALQEAHAGPESDGFLTARNKLAQLYRLQGRERESADLARRVLEVRRRVSGPDHPETLAAMNNLGLVLMDLRELDESEALLRHVVVRRLELLGPDHRHTLVSMSNLGAVLKEQGEYAEAETWTRREYEACRAKFTERHPDTLVSMTNLANLVDLTGGHAEALALRERAAELSEEVLGPDHRETLKARLALASSYQFADRLEDCERALARAFELGVGLDDDDPRMVQARTLEANLLRAQGRLAEAEERTIALLLEHQAATGGEDRRAAVLTLLLASVMDEQGRLEDALPVYAEAAELCALTMNGTGVQEGRIAYGRALLRAGRLDEAEPLLEGAYEELIATAPGSYLAPEAARQLARLCDARGAAEEAAAWRARAAPAAR